MSFENPLFIIPILTGPLILIVFLYVKKYPPNKINALYGYRTKRSMASQEAWDFAQILSTNLMIRYMIIYTVTAVLGLLIADSHSIWFVIIALVLMITFMAIPIIKTEKELKKRFG